MRVLSDALLKTAYIVFLESPPIKLTCANNILFGFFAEKEVNGLMEELFETVSNDLWVGVWDDKSGSSSKLCPLVPGPLLPESVQTKPISLLVHPGENVVAGEFC